MTKKSRRTTLQNRVGVKWDRAVEAMNNAWEKARANPNDKDAEKEFSRLVALANAYHMVWTDLENCETSR